MAYLKAKNGPLAGQRLELIEDSTVLGRSPECDIQVEDYAVSRKHAVLHLQDNQFLVEDLKSRNKTYLNDIALDDGKHQLRNGDKIGICDVVFHFYQDFGDSLDDSSMAAGLSVLFGDSEPVGGSTIMSKLDVHSSGGQVQLTASPQVTLNALIEITQSLGKALALDEVLPTVLDSLF
ncbi:MAG: FHA domain-containing protein, partial [Pirellulales bacterium]|nr:FHA domain-containing protein [Pirellulales bacterium]